MTFDKILEMTADMCSFSFSYKYDRSRVTAVLSRVRNTWYGEWNRFVVQYVAVQNLEYPFVV